MPCHRSPLPASAFRTTVVRAWAATQWPSTSVSIHRVITWATCASSPTYSWLPFAIMAVSTLAGPWASRRTEDVSSARSFSPPMSSFDPKKASTGHVTLVMAASGVWVPKKSLY